MRRGEVNGIDAMDTISAAATAVASLENRVPQTAFQIQKRRWANFWSIYWCFGSHKNNHRIGHAVLVPEPTSVASESPADGHPHQPLSIVLPFAAPPSSPASFLPSEPPSATQSPTGLLSLTSASASMYSPGGPSIFAIGPYAHETQLVSPPVFSTFTTEPSTAPYTPPPESVHLTTPSSPEVPFARLLEPKLQNGEGGRRYSLSQNEFHSYQLQPGSPVSHLISPCSGISGSGTTSPLPDHEFLNGLPFFLELITGNAPKLVNLDKIEHQESGSFAVSPDASGAGSCDSCLSNQQNSNAAPLLDMTKPKSDETIIAHRVSFDMTAEEFLKSVEKKPTATPSFPSESIENRGKETSIEMTNRVQDSSQQTFICLSEKAQAESDNENEPRHEKIRTITLGSSKEFNFDNLRDGLCNEPRIGSDWWANEQILGEDRATSDWSFCPVMQTGVS